MNITNIEQYLDSVGEKGSTQRLDIISNLDLGLRSEAAQRVVSKRTIRVYYLNEGMTFDEANAMLNYQ